jgi:hypothetical protein
MGNNKGRYDLLTNIYSKERTMTCKGVKSKVTVSISPDFTIPIVENATYTVLNVPFGSATGCWAAVKIQPPGTDVVPTLVPLYINSMDVSCEIVQLFDVGVSINVGMVPKIEYYNKGVFVYDSTHIHLIGYDAVIYYGDPNIAPYPATTNYSTLLQSVPYGPGTSLLYIDRFDQLLSGGIGDLLIERYKVSIINP